MNNTILSIINRNYHSCASLTAYEQSVFRKVLHCRSESVPGLYYQCDHCRRKHQVYKSCKNRMCPVCRGAETVKWTAKREAELLPVPYFLLTFTVPKQLRELFLYNKQVCYNVLFKSAGKTLLEMVRKNNRSFNGKTGFFSVLHTHDQRLNHHPHIHTVIPAGALGNDNTIWNHSHPAFLLPVKKLSAVFKDKLLFFLKKALKAGILVIPKSANNVSRLLNSLQTIPWVVNVQAPQKGKSNPQHIVRYLSRYVNKTPVSDDRIIKCENAKVYLRYVDRKKHKVKTEVISEELFLKRLAVHILPKGFKKVRFYGFMANRCRQTMLAVCRMLLGQPIAFQQESDESVNDTAFLFWKYFGIDISLCPDCGKGHLELKAGYTNTS